MSTLNATGRAPHLGRFVEPGSKPPRQSHAVSDPHEPEMSIPAVASRKSDCSGVCRGPSLPRRAGVQFARDGHRPDGAL
jgi:hypothetical protein